MFIDKVAKVGNENYFSETIFIPSDKIEKIKNEIKIVLVQDSKKVDRSVFLSFYKPGISNYVDDIDISGAAGLFNGTNEDFEVTTKTQISEKTFLNLSYKRSFSLNQDQSKVGVEYKLNRHFSVVGNVDEEGNLNLKYRYRYAY